MNEILDASSSTGWIEATVQFSNPTDEFLATFLAECCEQGGALGSVQQEEAGPGPRGRLKPPCEACARFAEAQLYFSPSSDPEDIINLVEKTQRTLQALFPDSAARLLGLRRVPNRNWALDWKGSFPPLRVSERIWVVPPWERPKPASGEIHIVLEPGMAFGTGRHATTRYCLEFLEELLSDPGRPSGPNSVLDAGCGSGILSLAAAALGARRVTALDKDPEAVRVCVRNLSLNPALAGSVSVAVGTPDCLRGSFDLVMANLDAPTLLAEASPVALLVAPGGRLVISGFLVGEEHRVASRFEKESFRILSAKRDAEEGWIALLLARQEQCLIGRKGAGPE